MGLWSRRRTKKPNKLVSISKYQSYHRHHLIRISSCHKLQLRAKKTKKNEFFSIPIETANYEKKKSSYQSKINHASIPLQHAFNSFGKWCSFPQELFVKNSGQRPRRKEEEEQQQHRQLLCYS